MNTLVELLAVTFSKVFKKLLMALKGFLSYSQFSFKPCFTIFTYKFNVEGRKGILEVQIIDE